MPHKYYISLTQVNYSEKERSLQITSEYFIDDIELALNERHGKTLDLATKIEKKEAQVFLEAYILQKFHVKVNGKTPEITYLGREYDYDKVYVYLEIENVDAIDSIEVSNRVLFDTYEEQQHYVKIRIGSLRKTMVLFAENDKEMLKL